MEPFAPFPSHRTGVWYPMVLGFPKYLPNLVSPELSDLTWCLARPHSPPNSCFLKHCSEILRQCPLALSTCSILR